MCICLRTHKQTLAALKADFASWWARPMDSIPALDLERFRRDALKDGKKKSTVNRAWAAPASRCYARLMNGA